MKKVVKTSKQIFDEIICKLDLRSGAPMGRNSDPENKKPAHLRIYDRSVPLIDGAYDKGGAYWGAPNNLRVEYTADKSYVRFYRGESPTKVKFLIESDDSGDVI